MAEPVCAEPVVVEYRTTSEVPWRNDRGTTRQLHTAGGQRVGVAALDLVPGSGVGATTDGRTR